MAPDALLTVPGRRDPLLCVSSQDFFLSNFKGVFSCPCGGQGAEPDLYGIQLIAPGN